MQQLKQFIAILLVSLPLKSSAVIIVRPAVVNDYESFCQLDRRVTFEFFKPLYQENYASFEFGKDPDPYLEEELADDEILFYQCAKGDIDKKLYVAYDDEQAKLAGFLLFNVDLDELYIDLFMIDEAFRNKGIGKQLISKMIADYSQAKTCTVEPLKRGNDATLAFYRSAGFVNKTMPLPDRLNSYGVPYAQLFLYYQLDVQTAAQNRIN